MFNHAKKFQVVMTLKNGVMGQVLTASDTFYVHYMGKYTSQEQSLICFHLHKIGCK